MTVLILEYPRSAKTYILRTNCLTDAQFDIILPDKSLQGAEMLTLVGKTESDCRLQCMLNYRCKSINYCHANEICQLNSKIIGDVRTNLVSRKGCQYKSTNYSSMKVSQ